MYRAGYFVEAGRLYCFEELRLGQALVLAQMHQAIFLFHISANGVLLGERSEGHTLFDSAQQTGGFHLGLDQHFNDDVLGRLPEQLLIVLVKVPRFLPARLGLVDDLFRTQLFDHEFCAYFLQPLLSIRHLLQPSPLRRRCQ